MPNISSSSLVDDISSIGKETQENEKKLGNGSSKSLKINTFTEYEDYTNGTRNINVVIEIEPPQNSQKKKKLKMGFLLDVSGSMKDTLYQVKEAMGSIIRKLSLDNDQIFVIKYNDNSTVIFDLETITKKNSPTILGEIQNLKADGGTDIGSALKKGISYFEKSSKEEENVLVLFTDGEATTGITSKDQFEEMLSGFGCKDNVRLVVFGFGEKGYNPIFNLFSNLKKIVKSELLQSIADQFTDGSTYAYITETKNQVNNESKLPTLNEHFDIALDVNYTKFAKDSRSNQKNRKF